MQHEEFVKNCYKYMKNKDSDLKIIWNFIQQKNITWIECFELKKGIYVIDGDLITTNLNDQHIYVDINKKITYS